MDYLYTKWNCAIVKRWCTRINSIVVVCGVLRLKIDSVPLKIAHPAITDLQLYCCYSKPQELYRGISVRPTSTHTYTSWLWYNKKLIVSPIKSALNRERHLNTSSTDRCALSVTNREITTTTVIPTHDIHIHMVEVAKVPTNRDAPTTTNRE